MKFIMLVKGNEEAEQGTLPDVKIFEEMNKYNEELKKAGMLITLDGLKPSKDGVRISFSEVGEPEVINGPFGNPEELVEGFWIINAKSMDDAIMWAKKAPFEGGVIEIRPIQEISDFPPEIQKVAKMNE